MHGKSNASLWFCTLAAMILIGEAKADCPAHTSCDPAPPKGFIFVDVTDAPADPCSGVKTSDGGGPGHVAGAAAADFDGDGWVDVFVSWDDTALYHNQGDGTFTRRQDVGIPATLAANTAGGLWFDYDNDGDLDLLIPIPQFAPDKLYQNDSIGGAIWFTGIDNDVSGLADAQLPNSTHGGICAGDINNDGWVDLLVARWDATQQNLLYLNKDDGNGGRTFDEITTSAGLIVPTGDHFFQCVMADFNDDGWIDIYQACDACADRLWINDQNNPPTFTERAADAGVPFGGHDMGVAVGDYDNDGDLDIYVTNIGKEAGIDPGSGCWLGGGASKTGCSRTEGWTARLRPVFPRCRTWP